MEAADANTPAAPAPAEGAPAPEVRPADALAREKAAARAKKHRALKKLKSAKGDEQLKKAAAEIAEGDKPAPPAWPTQSEIIAKANEIAPVIAEYVAPELAGTRYELTPKKMQILCFGVAPMLAQKSTGEGLAKLAQYVPPWLVGLGAVAIVFGPPLVAEIRETFGDAPKKPQQKPPEPPATITPRPPRGGPIDETKVAA